MERDRCQGGNGNEQHVFAAFEFQNNIQIFAYDSL